MLYLNLHIGDWISGTMLCSALERGVYIDLLVAYYSKGRPLMRSECDRIARAYTPDEREAMRYVLEQFFTADGDEYRNARADKEIAKCKNTSEVNRANARKRWDKEKQCGAADSEGDRTSETDATAYASAYANADANAMLTSNPKPETENSSVGAVESSPAPQQAAIDLPEPEQPKVEKKTASGSSKKVHLADAFSTLPDEWRKFCSDARPDLDAEKVFVTFRFYYVSGKGAKTVRTARGWSTAWKNWVVKEHLTEANKARPKEKTPEEHRAYQRDVAIAYGFPEKYADECVDNRYSTGSQSIEDAVLTTARPQ